MTSCASAIPHTVSDSHIHHEDDSGEEEELAGEDEGLLQVEKLQLQLHWLEELLSRMTVTAGVLFVIGSFDFLPDVARIETRRGCYLFLVGNALYLAAAAFDLEEAIGSRASRFELAINVLVVAASCTYLVSTFFYIPDVALSFERDRAAVIGSLGFIVGSALFVVACFIDGARGAVTGGAGAGGFFAMTASICNFGGSQLFLAGSVLFFPTNHYCRGDQVARSAATLLFVVGSALFTVAAVVPILRRNQRYLADLYRRKTTQFSTSYANFRSYLATPKTTHQRLVEMKSYFRRQHNSLFFHHHHSTDGPAPT